MDNEYRDAVQSVYHAGELAVQRQAGVELQARRVGQSIKSAIPPAAQTFLQEQPMAVVGAVAASGEVWASLFTGEPGFLQALDARTVRVAATLARSDPLAQQLEPGAAVGMLAIHLATRRRMRLNGVVERHDATGMVIAAQQVYANCPKYIQARELAPSSTAQPAATRQHSHHLSTTQQQWIAAVDTFFIASVHGEAGADVSHRGGNPGFIQVPDAATLLFPDYAGNTMFQTLGNLVANPQAGLLFVDWERGSTLQLTGTARVIWDSAQIRQFPGAERVVELQIQQVIEQGSVSALRAGGVSYSPANPGERRLRSAPRT